MNLEWEVAENGQVALDMVEKKSYYLYIVDLMMPVMHGRTMIPLLKEKHPEAVILVETGLDSPETIIEIMKMGVYDYIIKPIDPELFQAVLDKAIRYKYLHDMEKQLTQNAHYKLQAQLEWLNYKTTMVDHNQVKLEKNAIKNLQVSLVQGAGFGSMTTLIDMVKGAAQENEDFYQVDKNLMSMIFEHNSRNRNLLKGLATIVQLLDKKASLETIHGQKFISDFPEIFKDITTVARQVNMDISYPMLKKEVDLSVDVNMLKQAVKEIVVNALKYSKSHTSIDIFSYFSKNYFVLSFKNIVESDRIIPPGMEKMILEPFFRLQPSMHEEISSVEEFGFGLGLTVVDSIVRRHNGMFYIHNIRDHLGDSIQNGILAEIFLPIVQN